MVYQEGNPERSLPEQTLLEIERKFIVNELPSDLDTYDSVQIRQGYVVIEPSGTEVRLRQKGDAYFVTVKSVGDLVRSESEEKIKIEQFNALWPKTNGRRVEKTRYSIPQGDHIIELDVYKGALEGLVVAEVEFASVEESASFKPTSWMGQDVTKDKRYKNQQLALKGLPE